MVVLILGYALHHKAKKVNYLLGIRELGNSKDFQEVARLKSRGFPKDIIVLLRSSIFGAKYCLQSLSFEFLLHFLRIQIFFLTFPAEF